MNLREAGFTKLKLCVSFHLEEASPSASFLSGHPLTSNLLLQVEYNCDRLLQYDQFGLGFLIAEVELTHAAQLLKSLIDVPNTQPLAGVVCQPPCFLPLSLYLIWQIFFVFHIIQTIDEFVADKEGRKQ